MAIVTGDLYKGFTFGDISSKAYGVYITQEAAYDAPERDTEVVEIAGRNGAYILDKGRYKNITVSYKCGIALDDEQSFADAIRTFRNALASEAGKYVRLEDEYNPNEYRQAAFLGGIDVDMADRRAGEFTVYFDAKPQRFLKSGETAVTIGGDVTNTKTETGSIVSIESDGADKVTSLAAQIDPVQAGSGDPSPTNVRPITGWTAADVTVAGANLIDMQKIVTDASNANVYIQDGWLHFKTGGAASGQFKWNFGKAGQVAFKAIVKSAVATSNAIRFYVTYTDGTGANLVQVTTTDTNEHIVTGTTDANKTVADIRSANTDNKEAFCKLMAVMGSTPADYVPYTGHTTTVSLGQTVYGGTVDVVTGVLTVTRGYRLFTGADSEGWSASGSGRFYCALAGSYKEGYTRIECISNRGKFSDGSTVGTTFGSNSSLYYYPPSSVTDLSSFKSWLASNNLQVVYKLATPQTYNLTAQEVELLAGQNHVWADTGDITITWGDDPNKLVNPTLYDSHPLLSFTASGSGTITINSDTIEVTNQPIGDIILANVTKLASGESVTWSDTGRYLTGDAIRIDSIPAVQTTVVTDLYSYANYTNYISDDMDYLSTTNTSRGMLVTHSIPTPPQYVAGTAKSDTYSATVINKVKHKTTGNIVDCTINISINIAYDGANNITVTNTVTTSIGTASTTVTIDTVTVNSTKSSLTGTAYIDLDIGEAYSIDGSAVVSINDSVSLGASLPVLKPSVNAISKTGAVANLKVTPRWWEL